MIVNQEIIPNNHLFAYFSSEIIAPLLTLTCLLKMKDPYTYSHSIRVAKISYMIAKQMNLSDKQCEGIYIGGVLHDIGKIHVPENILNKPFKLTDDEFQIIKKHPEIGYEMLKSIKYLEKISILDSVLYHHERYDGKGYPHGLKDEEIPLVSRIIAVADSFDAMMSRRVYRDSQDLEYALNEIRTNKGLQFDPIVVNAFLDWFKNEKMNQYLIA